MQKRLPDSLPTGKDKRVNRGRSKPLSSDPVSSQTSQSPNIFTSVPLPRLKILPPIKLSYLFCEIVPNRFHQIYKYAGEIGKGANGVVFRALHTPSNTLRAIKVLQIPSDTPLAYSPKEIEILKSLDHPNVVRIYEACREKDIYYCVSEYCEGGSLFERILKEGVFSEGRCKALIEQVLLGLDYCHAKRIVHRDIKPENLLFESQKQDSLLKIIDFDISANFSQENLNQLCGSPYYIAPEILRGHYNEKIDVWSLGIVFYILVVGKPPIPGTTPIEILTNIRNLSEIDLTPAEGKLSDKGLKVLARMLETNYLLRASAAELLRAPWFFDQREKNFVEAPLLNSTLKSLRNFRSHTFLQNLIYFYTTNCILQKEERHKLSLIFRELDRDNDGRLSHEELVEAFVKTGRSFDRALMLVEKILQELGLDRNGITYNEFLLMCSKKQDAMSEESLRRAFKEWDIEKKGVISLSVIKKALKEGFFSNMDLPELDQMDEFENESLDYEGFKSIIQKFIEDEKVSQSFTYN